MKTLANIGARIQVTPWDEIFVKTTEDPGIYVHDPTPFEFLVEGWLEDGQIFYGLYGPVVSGPERYHNLICNIFVRLDGSDWRISSKSQANFKVGTSKATRCHSRDFRHPEGTEVSGLPLIARFGEICVAPTEDKHLDENGEAVQLVTLHVGDLRLIQGPPFSNPAHSFFQHNSPDRIDPGWMIVETLAGVQ